MEQNTQASENNNQAEDSVLLKNPKKKKNNKIVLLAGIVMIILGVVALYFLFFSNKENNNIPVLENEKVGEVEIDKELDSDQDGLPDYIERVLGTDENNSDTDGDGYGDFEEIKNGYNPLSNKEYTEEEWERVKEEIRSEDEEFYESIFINEDFSSPETTFEIYISAIETKNLNLYLKTYDKKSVDVLTQQDSVFAGNTNVDGWGPMLGKMFKEANYKISEQTTEYAIMAPEIREQDSASGKTVSMSDIYFQYEDKLWKINFITTLSDLTMRTPTEGLFSKEEKEEEIKQIKEDWRNSFK